MKRRFGGARITFHREAPTGVMLKLCWIMLDLELRWSLQLLKRFKCSNWPAKVINLLLLGLADRSFLEKLWSSSRVRSCRPPSPVRADPSCLPVNLSVGYLQLNVLFLIPVVTYVESRLLVPAEWKWNALRPEAALNTSFPLDKPLADQCSGSHRPCVSRIWERH